MLRASLMVSPLQTGWLPHAPLHRPATATAFAVTRLDNPKTVTPTSPPPRGEGQGGGRGIGELCRYDTYACARRGKLNSVIGASMPTDVKICGLKTEATLTAALEAGADYIGLNFYPNTPRRVDVATAAKLAATMRGRAKIVALVVDADDALIREIALAVAPDLFQLHGKETPERVAEITAMTGIPVMKAISVRTAEDATRALAYSGAAALILFDAKPPEGMKGAMPGGNGVAFDWRALLGVKDKVRYMLSGGLTPENVAEAIRLTGARAVDVSSGVESAPGEKDADKIRRFIAAAKSAG